MTIRQVITTIAACILLIATVDAAEEAPAEAFEVVFANHHGKLGYDRFKSEFLSAVEKHQKVGRKNKALAVARDVGGRWAYGTSHSERNRGDAKINAMQNCKKFRSKFAIDSPCKIYIVNKKIILKSY